MAEPRVVATVVRIDGQVFARNADGEVRLLKAGDTLLEGEVVITAAGGRVELAYADGGSTTIPADSSVLITEDMTEATRPDARAAAVEDATIAQVLQAIETGQDLEQVLEDPAAGLAGGGGGEGSNFVRLLRISEGVEGAAFEFAGARTGEVADFEGATAAAAAAEADAATLPEPVELNLTLVAPALTNDNTPTIAGSTNAPAGSQVTVVITDAAGVSQTVVVTVDAQGGFQVTPGVALADGPYVVAAQVDDGAGNTAEGGASGTVDATALPPAISLDNDTGAKGTDGVTRDGSYTVSGTEAGAVVEYSTDGVTWSTTAPTAVEGANTIQVRQTDVAGNVSAPATLTFTLDTAVAAPSIALVSDTGASATDGITKTGTYTVSGTESGAVVEYSTDGVTWTTAAPTAVEGANTIQVRQTDVAGNVSAPATLTFTLDTAVAAPSISLVSDTGASATDGITKTGTYTVSGTESGALAEYSTDGTTWTTTAPTAVEGANTIQVRQTDVAGNVSSPATLAFTLDTTASLTVSLADVNATNAAAAALTGTTSGIEAGRTVTLVVSDGDPATADVTVTATVGADGSYSSTADLSALSDGTLTVTASVTDAAGNSASATDTAALETTIASPSIRLDADTGASATDSITKIGTYTVSGTEAGAVVEYSTDGVTWSTTAPTAVEGANTIQVRQTDVAGNVSAPAVLRFTLDTAVAAPSIALVSDTGASTTDGITKTGTYTVSGTEAGAVVEYSTDGVTWTTTAPTAVEGANTIQVRQTDVAGNISAPVTLTFTLDTTVAAPTIALTTDTGSNTSDGITRDGSYSVSGTEPGALVEYSTDRVIWSTTAPTAVEGANTIQVRQTDMAGNVSAPATLSFTLDTQVAAPTIALEADTGSSDTDGITKSGTYTVTGTEAGAVVEYSTDGVTWSTTAPTAVEGANTIQVRQTDVAGNVSAPATLTFTLDTAVAAPSIALVSDTGASATDGITKTGTYTVSGTESSALVEYSTDGTTWTTTAPTAVDGAKTIQVRQTDVAGNVSAPATLTFTLDTAVAAPSISLVSDTGASATDGITKTGTYTVSGTESGALVEYSTDGTTWTTTAPTAVEGANTIQVRQTDVAGNVSAPATLTFMLDTTVAAPTIALEADTGSSGTDGVTQSGTYTVTGTEPGALVEYSTDGVNWSTTAPVAVEGANTIQVRQTDVAGNVSAPATLTFTLDTTAVITVAMPGVSGTNLTAVPVTGTTTGVEPGQTVTLVISDNDPSTADVTLTAVVSPGGSYSTTANLSSLIDGPLTVIATVTDLAGNAALASDTGLKAIADVPILAPINDIFILTPGSTVISTGGSDTVVTPGLSNSGDGVLQTDLERELGLPSGYFDSRFDPAGPNVTDIGFVNVLDGKITESHYALTTGATVSWNYIFTNGENLTGEVSNGFNDLVVLVVTDPQGNKHSILVNASEVKFPQSSISDSYTFTATSSGQYSFQWLVLNGGDRLKDSSLQLAAPSFRAPGDTAAYGAPVRLPVFAELADKSGSEVLSVVVSGVPAGARFISGTDNGDGSWSFTAAELGSLLLMPPASFSGALALTVTATALDTANGDTAVTQQTVNVTFDQTDSTVTTGTGASQSINGTTGDDLIRGYAGSDVINAREGDDLVFGGADNDTLRGGAGNDWLYGGQGNDTEYGDAGNDVLIGGAGNDNLYGGAGADVFKWQLGDQGSTSAPALDVVKDFAVAEGDVLDLRDLLVGDTHQGLDPGNLGEYLDFNFEPGSGGNLGTTVVSVKTQGAAMSAPDQIIRLENVDLLEGLTDDNQIIQKLLGNGRLITD